jgi:tetratricopeptide (TPR) repeat protein
MVNRDNGRPGRLNPGRLLVFCLMLGTLGWGALALASSWWFEAELRRAERDQAAGRYEAAFGRLERLAESRPGTAEVDYPLGVCAASLGRIDAALSAWARVPGRSPLAARAALDSARLALEHGRLAVAEASLAPWLDDRGEIGEQAARLADQVDLYTGRLRAIARRIEHRWASAPDPSRLLRLHWQLETQPVPVLALRAALDRMARQSPDDDRVWLGRADLAIRTGQTDEAIALLSRCEARRPGDPDVCRARLAWAQAAGRPVDVVTAASRLAPNDLTPAERARLAARLAVLRGDTAAERASLERLVAVQPGDPPAWERLAEIAARDGDRPRLAELRRRKAQIDRAIDEYRTTMGAAASVDPSRAAALARTAELLGRRFEARGWWTIQARRLPDDREANDALIRLTRVESDVNDAARTLADPLPARSASASTRTAEPPGVGPIPTFRDDADAAGLRFVYQNEPTPLCRLPESLGGGVGLIDYDGDDRLDVYCVQGGHLPNTVPPPPATQGDRLFRNRGDGRFEDVTIAAGIAAIPGGYGHGVSVGDYDNDGHPDLFITRWRSYALYRNRGDGTFQDVTAAAGLGGDRGWPTSSAFADLDGDGDLDLYVCHYCDWDPLRTPPCPHPNDANRHGYCVPRSIAALPDRVFRNDSGRFVDVSDSSGVTAADGDGRGLGVVAAHLDDDDRIDLYVANDMTANRLFLNRDGLRLEEKAAEAGVATNAEGGYLAGMGIACGDLDGDGRPDLAVTNFYGESTTFYRNLGGGQFADQTSAVRLSAPTRHVLGFGLAFLDANNDGRLDLAQADGHVNDYRPSIPFAMPSQLFLGTPSGPLVNVSLLAGDAWQTPRHGRGLAVGDLDNDGKPDVLVVASGQPLAYLHNQGPAGHFLTLQLEGASPHSNRDAIGARVAVTAGGRRQAAQRIGGGSYLSASDPRLHFGLGNATRIESIEVRWPSGRVDRFAGLPADAAYQLREGEPQARRLSGWRAR